MSDTTEPQNSDTGSDTTEAAPALTVNDALAEWRQLTTDRAAAEAAYEDNIAPLRAEFEEKMAPLDDRMAELERWFMIQAEAEGLDSFESEAGTVAVSTRETPKITDADAFFTWAATSNNVSLLQKRISVTEYREFIKANPNGEPPGVTVEETRSAKFKPAK